MRGLAYDTIPPYTHNAQRGAGAFSARARRNIRGRNAERLTDGRLYGIDRDGEAIAAASERLKPFGDKFKAIRGNFFDMKSLLANEGVTGVEGILLDLGVSSYQLDTPERGFSYHEEAPLDMRMDDRASLSAYDVVNGYSHGELTRIIRD